MSSRVGELRPPLTFLDGLLACFYATFVFKWRRAGAGAWEKQPRLTRLFLRLQWVSCVVDSSKCGMEWNVVPGDGMARTGRVTSGSAHSAQARPPSPTSQYSKSSGMYCHNAIIWPVLGELSRALPTVLKRGLDL